MDNRVVKAKNNESGTLGALLSVAEVTSATVSPVPANTPGIIVFEPGTANEEHVFFKKSNSGAGTISGLIRDITNLNGGVGIEHANGASWETQQATEYVNNMVDALQEGWVGESQAVAKVDGDTFTVEGNQTAIYTAGKFVRYNQDNTKIGVVVSSSYSGGSGLTTVEMKGFTVPVLTSVETALFQPKGFSGAMPVFYGEDAGSNDTYVVTVAPTIGAYFKGMIVVFQANTINTGAATLNVNSLGAISIKKDYNVALDDGDIKASEYVAVVYDGTNFQLISPIYGVLRPSAIVVAATLVLPQGTSMAPTAEGSMGWDTDDDRLKVGDGAAAKVFIPDSDKQIAISFLIDGSGAVPTTGLKGSIMIPFACTINQAEIVADVSGSAVVDIWKDTYANYPPVVGDSITASAKPTLSTAIKATDSTLTGWTTTIAAGDYLHFNLDSVTTCTWILVTLRVKRT